MSESKDKSKPTITGGAYIPPARLRMMREKISDKSSVEYQKMSWEALKKSLHGLINKVTISNLVEISKELMHENLVRGKGLLVRSLMQSQQASLSFSHVYAALVAVLNTKFPELGELLLDRLVWQFKRGYKRSNKASVLATVTFIAHLVNQNVSHEIIVLEILTLLLDKATDDSVEVAVGLLKHCGCKLQAVAPICCIGIYDTLKTILSEGSIDLRVRYMVEVMFAIRKDGYKDYPAILEDLDLVPEDSYHVHTKELEDHYDKKDHLNLFKVDQNYLENEKKYDLIKDELLNEESDDEDDDDDEEEDDEDGGEGEGGMEIVDRTETNLTTLRRNIYLTIKSSLTYDECAHKLTKMQIKPGQERELCNMIMDCCAQERTYEKFYGQLAQTFCMIHQKYLSPFEELFGEQYTSIHRLESAKLRNVALLFSHLLHSDAISWQVLGVVQLTEQDTTSSGRVFLKCLFLDLCEFMGLKKLKERLKDETLAASFEGIFPRDDPIKTRFSINFFTSIGLGPLTDELRGHLKGVMIANRNKQHQQQAYNNNAKRERKSSSSSSSSSDSD